MSDFKVGDTVQFLLPGHSCHKAVGVIERMSEARLVARLKNAWYDYLEYPKAYFSHYTPPAPTTGHAGQAGGLKFDAGKLVWDLLLNVKGCIAALEGVVRVLMFGAKKYKAHSWREVEDAERRYLDGLMRHYTEIKKHGLDAVDSESGELHIHHLNCNGLFLAELAISKQCSTPTTTKENV